LKVDNAKDSKSGLGNQVRVRFSPSAPLKKSRRYELESIRQKRQAKTPVDAM
jgi:hypothetical protein